MIERAGGEKPSRISHARALACILTPRSVTGAVTEARPAVTHYVPPAVGAAAAEAKMGAKKASMAMSTHPDDANPEAWTEDMKADMQRQGASRLSQLPFLSVSAELGHKAAPSEYAGAAYNGSVEMAAGVKAAAKSKHTMTLSGLWRAAVETGDNTFLDRHVDRLVTSMVRDSTDSFAMTAGSRVMQAWGKAKGMGRQDSRITAMYWGLLWEENPGMGLREIVDMNLLETARNSLYEVDRAKQRAGEKSIPLSALGQRVAPDHGSSEDTRSLASVPQSVGSLTRDEGVATMIKELRAEMAARAEEEKKAREALAKRVGDLQSELGKAKADLRSTRGKGCFRCGKTGHVEANCPEKDRPGSE